MSRMRVEKKRHAAKKCHCPISSYRPLSAVITLSKPDRYILAPVAKLIPSLNGTLFAEKSNLL